MHPTKPKMSSKHKKLQLLTNSKSYAEWLELIYIWRKFTNPELEKQGAAIVFLLEGEAQNAILEHDTSSVSQKDGVDRIIVHLNQQYKKDELT